MQYVICNMYYVNQDSLIPTKASMRYRLLQQERNLKKWLISNKIRTYTENTEKSQSSTE